MRILIIVLILLSFVVTPVYAMEFSAPDAPDCAQDLFPKERSTFANDLLTILQNAMKDLRPSLLQAAGSCAMVLSISLLLRTLTGFSGVSPNYTELAGVVMISAVLIKPANTLIRLGIETIRQLSDYGKLLIPVMTSALAAQGGTTKSASLYAGTVLLNTVMSSGLSSFMAPTIYMFLCLGICNAAVGDGLLDQLRALLKWLMTWIVKTVLYIFTGYIGITGVVSGSVDAAAVKATKLTLSGVVPVVGGILSDASEAVLVSAGILKNAAGVYGLLTFAAIIAGPFIRIGSQYLLLKATAALCGAFGTKRTSSVIADFTGAMGIVLAVTGAVSLILMISTVCFMKGVT